MCAVHAPQGLSDPADALIEDGFVGAQTQPDAARAVISKERGLERPDKEMPSWGYKYLLAFEGIINCDAVNLKGAQVEPVALFRDDVTRMPYEEFKVQFKVHESR